MMPRAITHGLETFGLYSNRFMVDSIELKLRAARHNLESLHLLPELGLPFLPQTSFALSASAIRIVLNDTVLHRRRCVIEFGSGLSTLYWAKVLAEQPDSILISIDHDAEWLQRVGDMLQRIGSTASVRLVHAPLVAAEGNAPWYAREPVEAAIQHRLVDAVLVDGPKARGANDDQTRHPALPFLASRLNPDGAIVFLDDIKRAGERRIYEGWANVFQMDPVRDAEFCGLGILVPKGRPLKYKIV